jgi:hypothetical protein
MAATEQLDRSVLAQAEAELQRRVPDADAGLIRDLVTKAYDELMPAKVQGYMPVLIVHQVRDILDGRRTAA